MKQLSNLKAMLAFRHAGESLSFKEAANKLNVTQAAISQQIKALESHLGMSLFKRLTREVELTPEGAQFLPFATEAFRLLEKGVAGLSDDPNPNRLTVSIIPSFAGRWLVPRLGKFQEMEPGFGVNLSPTLVNASFEDEDIDVALRFGTGDYPGLKSIKLFEEYLVPVCHPDLIDHNKPILEQLRKLPLLVDTTSDIKPIWAKFEQATGIKLDSRDPRLNVPDSNMLVDAVLSGQGLALIRYSLSHELLERGQLLCPTSIYLKHKYDYYLVAPQSHFERPKVKIFGRWVRKELSIMQNKWEIFKSETLSSL